MFSSIIFHNHRLFGYLVHKKWRLCGIPGHIVLKRLLSARVRPFLLAPGKWLWILPADLNKKYPEFIESIYIYMFSSTNHGENKLKSLINLNQLMITDVHPIHPRHFLGRFPAASALQGAWAKASPCTVSTTCVRRIGFRNVDECNIESGWWFQSLWKILVSWDDYSQYMEK